MYVAEKEVLVEEEVGEEGHEVVGCEYDVSVLGKVFSMEVAVEGEHEEVGRGFDV